MRTSWCRWNSVLLRCSGTAATAAVLLLSSAGGALAHGYRFGALEILHPVITEPGNGAKGTCARLTIINHGRSTDYLLGISAEAAARTLILATTGDRERPARIAIAPGARIELRRPAWCILLHRLTTSLAADVGEVAGTLTFEKQGTVRIDFMIAPPGHDMH